jgi:hypothetical protein
MNTPAHTVRVSCDCDVCKVNAAALGLPFPLAALIRPLAAKNLGVTERNANKASKVHGFVYTAYDPSLKGLPVERRFAVAVTA